MKLVIKGRGGCWKSKIEPVFVTITLSAVLLKKTFLVHILSLGKVEIRVEAKSVAPVKPVLHTVKLFKPTHKPGKIDYIDIDIRAN